MVFSDQTFETIHRHLTHLLLMPHIYASENRDSIGSDNGSDIRRQAII